MTPLNCDVIQVRRHLCVPDEITVERLQHGQEVGVGEAALHELLLRDDAVAVNVQRVEDVQSPFDRIQLKSKQGFVKCYVNYDLALDLL